MPKLLPLGDAAWTVEFGEAVDPALHARVMGFAQALERAALPGVIEWVPTFRSCTVHFDPLSPLADGLGERLLEIAAGAPAAAVLGRRWRIPVLFGGEAGPDLAELAARCGTSAEAIVARMTAAVFRVYMLGFMPGFPYMGGLPEELAMPRLATPRKQVPARSLAVTGTLCAIYPFASPGGWRLLGRTPLALFDVRRPAPALFAPGDEAMWQAIDATECARLEAEEAAGRLDRAAFLVAPEAPWPR
ncbi:MAG: 5-oxoprolinase subunit PxpB [Betaproteobacteria bacterium]|nr:5-oxoprolinase subunit PxpB [Betaproteobacteria bacterium]